MKSCNKKMHGFTLIEMMVALTIAGITLLVFFAFSTSQSKNYDTQSQVVELQQGLRVSLSLIERELRQTGYNPGGLTRSLAETDTVDNDCDGTTDENDNLLTLMVDESEAIGLKSAIANMVSFSYDKNGDGLACGNKESVTYALNGTTFERNGSPKLGNVEVLNFVYLEEDGTVATEIDEAHAVQVAMIGRTKKEDSSYVNSTSYRNLQGVEVLAPQNDGYRRRLLTSQVSLRNLKD